MKAFRFSLQTALQHRKSVEDKAMEALAQAVQAHADAKGDLHRIDQLIAGSLESTLAVEPFQMVRQQAYLEQLERRRLQQLAVVQERAFAADAARKVLARASAEREMLDRYRQRQQSDWSAELERDMERELGEVAISQVHRRRQEGTK